MEQEPNKNRQNTEDLNTNPEWRKDGKFLINDQTGQINYIGEMNELEIKAPATEQRKTLQCFDDKPYEERASKYVKWYKRYEYRDPDLDLLLPESWPQSSGGQYSMQEYYPTSTKQAVEIYFGQTGDIATLSDLLKKSGALATLPEIQALIDQKEDGHRATNLGLNCYENYFFVENKTGGISVIRALHLVAWHIFVEEFDNAQLSNSLSAFYFRNKTS